METPHLLQAIHTRASSSILLDRLSRYCHESLLCSLSSFLLALSTADTENRLLSFLSQPFITLRTVIMPTFLQAKRATSSHLSLKDMCPGFWPFLMLSLGALHMFLEAEVLNLLGDACRQCLHISWCWSPSYQQAEHPGQARSHATELLPDHCFLPLASLVSSCLILLLFLFNMKEKKKKKGFVLVSPQVSQWLGAWRGWPDIVALCSTWKGQECRTYCSWPK